MSKADLVKKAIDAARKTLAKIATPEEAIALTGKKREQYLEALDTVYGDKATRAADMGFSPDTLYHGTDYNGVIDAFNPSSKGIMGPGVYMTGSLEKAAKYGKNVIPLKSKKVDQINVKSGGKGDSHQQVVKNSSDIRSTDAAFDPRFKDSNKIMAGGVAGVGQDSLLDVATDFGNWIEKKTGYGDLIEALKREGATKSAKLGRPDYEPTEQDIQEFSKTVDTAAELAGAGMGTVQKLPKAIVAPTSAAGVQMSNQIGKTPFGKVIMVPNNTVKGYAAGGPVEEETNIFGLPTFASIAAKQTPEVQLLAEDPLTAQQVLPSQMETIGAALEAQGAEAQAARDARAAQFGVAPQQAAVPMNIDLGVPTSVAPDAGVPIEPAVNPMQASGDAYTRAIRAEAKAQADLGNEQALIQQQEQARIQGIEAEYQNNFNALESERQAIMEDIKNSQIDPNRFIGQMGTGAKVGTAIGLLLSGFGAGLQGGKENMAMSFLDKQIDNDIKAQQSELGKKNNLLSATMTQFGNMRDATAMARVITSDLYASKIKEAAARSMDPMAKARAEQAIAEMQMKNAPVLQELAKKQTIMQGLKTGQVKTAEAVPFLVPEKDRAKAFEEISKVETAEQQINDITKAMEEMAQVQTLANRAANPIQSSNQMAALQTSVMGALKPIFGALSESDKKEAMANVPKVLDSPETIRMKMNNMRRLARDAAGSTPTLDAYRVPVDKSKLGEVRRTLNPAMFKSSKGK